MKIQFFVLLVILAIAGLPAASGQGSVAPVCIENWEGYCYFSEFLYEEPQDAGLYESNTVQDAFALEGKKSRMITWQLKGKGKYFGWGVDLTQGDTAKGFNASNVVAIYFKIKLNSGDETFKINIKDMQGTQPGLSSISFLSNTTQIQEVKIPIQRFGTAVNLGSLKDINLSFDRANASRKGSIVIDDFKFIYQ